MQDRLKTGGVLVLLYTILFAIAESVQIVPGLSGLRLAGMLSVPYGLIFGRLGAISAALGAALGMVVTGGNSNFIPIEFLGALLSAYLPFRVWQGMRSPREPYLCVATGLTPAVIGDSDSLAVGETTTAVGNPLGTLSNTVTNGIVSALNREVTVQGNDMNLIQTSASISPGNSGGGLFNANGELIGIVNAKSSSSDAEGLGFAIPINTAMEMAKQMIEKGYVARPAMGVTVITINDAQTAMQYGVSNYGVYIYQIASGSGAEKGGLKLGDRIISIDDVAVSSASDVQKYCQSKEVGDTVTLQVERDGKVISCEVTLGESTQSTATAESGN